MDRADALVSATLVALLAVAVVGLLFLGPVGWGLAASLVVAGLVLAQYSGVFGAATSTERRNCGDCGAPNRLDREACRHCGASLE
ncbi:zinc ribbon domain-containing protein [Haloarcula litorea]|uniref:zinc ribbon domain-containing protein n=1 Tax=Haloarcula litorea TaxID=3032579 RepID=UPI0023E89642|nr:zinc ribbon domain-containing protein [Halomicroarcula sp. GDY20]